MHLIFTGLTLETGTHQGTLTLTGFESVYNTSLLAHDIEHLLCGLGFSQQEEDLILDKRAVASDSYWDAHTEWAIYLRSLPKTPGVKFEVKVTLNPLTIETTIL